MSLISSLRRLGWRGLANRAWVATLDSFDWLTSLRLPRDLRIDLQPWRFGGSLKSMLVSELEPAGEQRPLPQVAIYDTPGGIIDKPPPTTTRVAPRRLYRLRDAVVLPRHIILSNGGRTRMVPWSFFARGKRILGEFKHANGDVWLTDPVARRKAVRIEGPVLVADSTHYDYGHVLLEIATRLAYLDLCPPGTRVLTPIPLRPAYLSFFDAMGVDRERIVSMEGPVFCDDVYFGDSLVDIRRFTSSRAWECFERIGRLANRSSVPTFDRIYVSRRGVGRRPLVNEAAIEELFRGFGFTIISPETMPIEDQIRVFAQAKMIAGPRGSGIHNSVFSAADAKLLLLTFRGFLLPIDTLLTREDDTLAYAIGERVGNKPGDSRYLSKWTIDHALVERAIRSHFKL